MTHCVPTLSRKKVKLIAYVSPELRARLEGLAREDSRSLSNFVEKLIEEALRSRSV